jgi:hypothetical protein
MRHATTLVLISFLSIVLGAVGARAADDAKETQYPLGSSHLQISGGTKAAGRKITFSGSWSGTDQAMPNPKFSGATLRVIGGPGEGDSGLIQLPPGNWTVMPKNKGYRYKDNRGLAGGVKLILVKLTKNGGKLKIVGGSSRWAYQVSKPQTVVDVTFISGSTRWCAQLSTPKTKKTTVRAKTTEAPATCPCDSFGSTWEAIQGSVIARHGCTQGACHDSTKSGGLDLRPANAYANLVNADSPFGIKRVEPYSPQDSLLWQKLAASTLGYDLAGKGSPMPSGGLPAISADELTAIRMWIQQGAPETGVVPGTETLLNSCLPKAEPPVDEPLAAPAPTDGAQFHAPPWTIPPRNAQGQNGENEVCYATYYNLAGQIPAEDLVPCPPGIFDGPTNPTKQCFSYDHQLLRQSPNSHHSIIHIYNGAYASNDPSWGYTCQGGTVPDGTACDPTHPGTAAPAGDDCGGGLCRSKVVPSVACLFGFGPPDYEGGVLGNGSPAAPAFSGSQQPRFERIDPEGVFSILPVEGTIIWNSHAFNVFDTPVINQQWLNLWYTGDRVFPLQGTFDSDDIFIQHVAPFDEVEYCRTILYGKGTRIADFSSHTHKRGRLFRVWGPGITQACASKGGTRTAPRPGDAPDPCIAETTPPIMVTTTYNDPAQLIYKPPLPLDGDDPTSRRFKFCATYDNGYNDPSTVKRNSTSPNVVLGGKCWHSPPRPGETIYCANRKDANGLPISCGGDDRVCDSSPGANDGVCDACMLRGGVSTEDEMFILIGSYYCDTTVPGESCTGVCEGGSRKGQACHGNDSECPGNANSCRARDATKPEQLTCGDGTACTSAADCTSSCVPYTNL